MSLKNFMKRIYYAINPSNRIVLLDYAIDPKPTYTSNSPHKSLYEFVSGNDEQYKDILDLALQYKDRFADIKEHKAERDLSKPTWNNGYVPGLDIIMLYTLVTQLKPKKYIEIGSGTTTKTVHKARKENNLDFKITCIDPSPRQEIKEIADEWHASFIQQEPLDMFKSLSKDDIVFFDGTHTLYPNSDVMWFFLEILPVLPNGVVVQVHDIYIPYDYPQFMLDRYYSENYLLGALLLNNPDRYEIIAPNFYISKQPHLASIISKIWDHPNLATVEKHGGSFWFRTK
jgi:hypothetical protein